MQRGAEKRCGTDIGDIMWVEEREAVALGAGRNVSLGVKDSLPHGTLSGVLFILT